MRLRDTIRRGAEPGRGELPCRRRKRILSSAVTICACSKKSYRRQELEWLRKESGRRTKDPCRTCLCDHQCRDLTTGTVTSHAHCTPLRLTNWRLRRETCLTGDPNPGQGRFQEEAKKTGRKVEKEQWLAAHARRRFRQLCVRAD